MSGNLPPGVSGMEWQIAGFPEREEVVTCDAEDVDIITFSQLGLKYLQDSRRHPGSSTYQILAQAEVEYVRMEECGWTGMVAIAVYDGMWHWTCPLCRTDHDGEEVPRGD